ncbi:hypothetical protein JOE11_000522 [Robbsia andropogonis]
MSQDTTQPPILDQRATQKARPTRSAAKPAPGTAEKWKHIKESMRDPEKHRNNGY